MGNFLILAFLAGSAVAQAQIRKQIETIAVGAHGKICVACSLPGSVIDCDVNAHARAPMFSVFKLPLAMAVLNQVEQGTTSLDHPVEFLAEDRIAFAYSPLQDQYPAAGNEPVR